MGLVRTVDIVNVGLFRDGDAKPSLVTGVPIDQNLGVADAHVRSADHSKLAVGQSVIIMDTERWYDYEARVRRSAKRAG